MASIAPELAPFMKLMQEQQAQFREQLQKMYQLIARQEELTGRNPFAAPDPAAPNQSQSPPAIDQPAAASPGGPSSISETTPPPSASVPEPPPPKTAPPATITPRQGTRFSEEVEATLHAEFAKNHNLSKPEIHELAVRLELQDRQVSTFWTRQRTKLKKQQDASKGEDSDGDEPAEKRTGGRATRPGVASTTSSPGAAAPRRAAVVLDDDDDSQESSAFVGDEDSGRPTASSSKAPPATATASPPRTPSPPASSPAVPAPATATPPPPSPPPADTTDANLLEDGDGELLIDPETARNTAVNRDPPAAPAQRHGCRRRRNKLRRVSWPSEDRMAAYFSFASIRDDPEGPARDRTVAAQAAHERQLERELLTRRPTSASASGRPAAPPAPGPPPHGPHPAVYAAPLRAVAAIPWRQPADLVIEGEPPPPVVRDLASRHQLPTP
ncbi:hypothetical protein PAPYR_10353 [Paratrimastix pyriformis]|uniref:Homeobox domain-containing protein n=1 Tax=Paratrimastix pyriformis TaxID=342808 RepID=A0ABQ8U674_9EUKA|nr:hypothetical protein PAPYR_10353 [Paratrimastix pyriformis]